MESSRTFLALRTSSRTHFEVLGLDLKGQVLRLYLEASSPRKLPCPQPRTALFFETLKFCGKTPETLRKICGDLFCLFLFLFLFIFLRLPEKFFLKTIFYFLFFEIVLKKCLSFFSSTLSPMSLVLDHDFTFEHSFPWSREGLSSRS